MSDMESFYTRDASNEGIKLPLSSLDGSATDHYICIRGIDSDAFRDAETKAKRSVIESGGDDSEDLAKSGALDIVTSLVKSWSFDEKCEPADVREFLEKAPQIADEVYRVAGDRALFFALKSNGSKRTRKKK